MTDTSTPRNPRYLSIPTLMAALVCAQFVQAMTGPLEFGAVASSILYLMSFATPIAIKRALTLDEDYDADDHSEQEIRRLPTSRFSTVPGRPSLRRLETINRTLV